MNALKKWIKWLRSPGPHFRKVQELARVTSPDGKHDAVLIRSGPTTAILRVVAYEKEVYGHENLGVLIHCSDLVMDWEGDNIEIRGDCRDFTSKYGAEQSTGSYTFKVPDRLLN